MTLGLLRRASTTIALTLTVAGALTVAVPGAATASTTGPAITAPAAGQTVPFRFTGPLTVDMTGAAPGDYTGLLSCRSGDANGTSQTMSLPQFTWDGATDPVRSFTAPEPLVTRYGTCTWDVVKAPIGATVETVATVSFKLASPPDPTILAPSSGDKLPVGATGPFTVDLTGADPGTYWNWIRCGNPGYGTDINLGDVTWDGATEPVRTFTATQELPTLQDCTWSIYKGYMPEWIGDRVTFRVEKRALEMTNVSQTPATFYPLVRDGYRDTSSTRYYLTREATGSVTVTNSTGAVVRRQSGLSLAEGWHTWGWNGRNDAGNLVPAGNYRVTVRNSDTSGNTRSFTTSVTVATQVLVKSGKAHFYGSGGRRATAGNCTARYDGAATELDCWGGRYAEVRFGFTIPAQAYNTRVKVSGYIPDADLCCDGRITRRTVRPTARSLVTRVKVTGWRAYTVLGVTATWNYKQRI